MVKNDHKQVKLEENMTTLVQKLQLKDGQSLKLVNSPAGYEAFLTSEGIQTGAGPDAVLIFTSSLAEVNQVVPPAFQSVHTDALVWVAYPKGSSGVKTDVNRDKLWDALKPTGWRPVRQIAMDNVWSALRFRPADKVGK
jgi:hypothetical protein